MAMSADIVLYYRKTVCCHQAIKDQITCFFGALNYHILLLAIISRAEQQMKSQGFIEHLYKIKGPMNFEILLPKR